MKTRKIPLRSCVITKEKLPKQELFRFVRTPEGEVILDLSGKANGRGAYVKRDIDVIKKAQESKTLAANLKSTIKDEVYEEAVRIINSTN